MIRTLWRKFAQMITFEIFPDCVKVYCTINRQVYYSRVASNYPNTKDETMSNTLYNIMGDNCDGSAPENCIDREVVRLNRSIERRTRQIAKYRGIIALIDMGGM